MVAPNCHAAGFQRISVLGISALTYRVRAILLTLHIDETSCASTNGLSRTAQLGESSQGDVREAVSIAIEACGDSARLSGNYVIAIVVAQSRDRGNASAQMKAAYLYEEGLGGTAVDYTQAYKWYDIAAAVVGAKIDQLPVAATHNGEKDNSDQLWYRDQVAKRMTSEQIAEAQRLAREWKPEHNSTASLP